MSQDAAGSLPLLFHTCNQTLPAVIVFGHTGRSFLCLVRTRQQAFMESRVEDVTAPCPCCAQRSNAVVKEPTATVQLLPLPAKDVKLGWVKTCSGKPINTPSNHDTSSSSFVNPPLETYFSISPEEQRHAQQQQEELFEQWRDQILNEESFFLSEDLSEPAGSDPAVHTFAIKLRENGRIFGVFHDGLYRYPMFQFSADRQPLDAMNALLAFIPPESREWPLMLWFWSLSALLDGRLPRDLMREGISDNDRERLLHAARTDWYPSLP